MRYEVEAGRTLTIDGEPQLYIGGVSIGPRGYAMAPAHLDQLTHKIAALLNGDSDYTYCGKVYPVDEAIPGVPNRR